MTLDETVRAVELECAVLYREWLSAGERLRQKQVRRDALRAEREQVEARERRQLAKVLG
jgi:hypothetical protein